MNPKKTARGLFAASLDPITYGHVHLIEKAAALFPAGLTVLVATNPNKAKPVFGTSERVRIAQAALKHLPNVEVTNAPGIFSADYAQRHGIEYLVRGIRSASDTEAETRIAQYNALIAPSVQTLALPAPEKLGAVSSSELRGLVGFHGWIDIALQVAPEASVAALVEEETRRQFFSIAPDWPGTIHWWDSIRETYSQFAYHNLEHILRCVEWLNVLGVQSRSLKIAIFLHDLVRGNSDKENVQKSAHLARTLPYRFDPEAIQTCILATDHANPIRPKAPEAKLLHDIDLAILGASPTTYQRYTTQIRTEYASTPAKLFREGRTKFLQGLLTKKIFLTKEFEGLENQAKENIKAELQGLTGE